jgi:glutamate-1-semialdehyde aminotransferase
MSTNDRPPLYTLTGGAELQRTEALIGQADKILAHRRPLGPLEFALSQSGFTVPKLVERGNGCRIYDTFGNEFIDWHQGFGATLLGHRNSEVENAIQEQLGRGVNLSASSPLEVEVAVALCDMIPSAEMVSFGKNGSDATHAAIRLARAITDREMVFTTEYHGFHNWSLASDPTCEGVPRAQRDLIRTIPYNDIEALEEMFREHPDEVAGLIVDPIRREIPNSDWFEGLRSLADRYGALLIFDEVVTGFRFSPGGVQELYGIIPDLTCVAKALANGMPLSALLGKRKYMERLPQIYFGMTYRGEALSYASALASLSIYKRESVHEHVARIGTELRKRFDILAATHDIPITLKGHPSRMEVTFGCAGRISELGIQRLFVQELVRNGIYSDGLFLPSYPMNDEIVELTATALDETMRVVRTAKDRNTLEGFLVYSPTEDCYRKT